MDLVVSTPMAVLEMVNMETADKAVAALTEAGATVKLG